MKSLLKPHYRWSWEHNRCFLAGWRGEMLIEGGGKYRIPESFVPAKRLEEIYAYAYDCGPFLESIH
jgi:hypothetical protein